MIFKFFSRQSESGQALLIVVLVMVVALTVGLSVASRTVTNLRTTAEEENSQRAFSAAEAGIEKALKTGPISSPLDLGNNASIESVQIVGVSGTEFLLNGGNPVLQDDGFDLWLSSYPDYTNPWPQASNGFVSIYWGTATNNCSGTMPAAIEVVLLIGPKTSPSTARFAFDPCSARLGSNGFQTANVGAYTVSSKTFPYQATFPVALGTGLLARIIPLYSSTPVGVKGCDSSGDSCIAFPPQGSSIDSVGSSGGTKRKITVFQGFPQLPSEFFPYILFQTKE